MNPWRGLVLGCGAGLLIAQPAAACRCVPAPLTTYFERADVVAVAVVRQVTAAEGAPARMVLELDAATKRFKGSLQPADRFVTPASSSECGLHAESGRRYLLFGIREEGDRSRLRVDSCSGSRPFDTGVGAGLGFVDTPGDQVLRRLAELSGERASAGATPVPPRAGAFRLPLHGDPNAELIGLLEIPSLLNLDQPQADSPPPRRPVVPLHVYAEAAADSAVLARLQSAHDLRTREVSYETAAAVVRAQVPDWYRIVLRDGRLGWLRARDAGKFYPLAELLVNRLNYLTVDWDGFVWPEPGAGIPAAVRRDDEPARQEAPARVIAVQVVGDSAWIQIEVLTTDGCDGATPQVRGGGWVPAYAPTGEVIVWYHSRGC